MEKYINILMKRGYTRETAQQICEDFVRNLSLFDLECFVLSVRCINVDQVQSKSHW